MRERDQAEDIKPVREREPGREIKPVREREAGTEPVRRHKACERESQAGR